MDKYDTRKLAREMEAELERWWQERGESFEDRDGAVVTGAELLQLLGRLIEVIGDTGT